LVHRPEVDHKTCLVLLPLRAPFLEYFESIVKVAAANAGLNAVKADEIYGTRAVISDIWDLIWKARVVVCIVSDQNPNVNYELGMCHALGVPTILVTERPEDVPFDYRHRRFVRYSPQADGWRQRLIADLSNTIHHTLSSPAADHELAWPYNTLEPAHTDVVEYLNRAKKNVDARMGRLVGGEVQALFASMRMLLTESKYQLSDTEKFRGFCIKTLEAYPEREFWATSLASSKYFWKAGGAVEQAIAKFIERGGRMKRIFLLESPKGPDADQVMARQHKMGVEVYVAHRRHIPADLARYFMVETQGEITWQTIPNSDKSLSSVWVIAGPEHTEEYLRDWTRLKELSCVEPYVPPRTS
jgi:hypothetical protein